jgi:hypothetical protein
LKQSGDLKNARCARFYEFARSLTWALGVTHRVYVIQINNGRSLCALRPPGLDGQDGYPSGILRRIP